MIIRPRYLEMLKTYRDVPLVKILVGIRRCGKSTVLEMLEKDLIKAVFSVVACQGRIHFSSLFLDFPCFPCSKIVENDTL